jgi:hypothetical protein
MKETTKNWRSYLLFKESEVYMPDESGSWGNGELKKLYICMIPADKMAEVFDLPNDGKNIGTVCLHEYGVTEEEALKKFEVKYKHYFA